MALHQQTSYQMEESPPTSKRTMEFPTEGQPPNKQISFDSTSFSCTPNEQNSTEKNPGLEDDSVSSGNKGCSEGCGNDEKFHNETERNEENHGVNKIQPEVEPVPIPPPGPIQFTSVESDSVSLVWGPPVGWSGCQKFKVTWESGGTPNSRVVTSSKACICDLSPGEKYEFKVATLGEDNQQSKCVSATTHTEIPAPEELEVKKDEGPVLVTWRKPERLDQVEYVLSLWKKGNKGGEEECLSTIKATSEEYRLLDLELNIKYIVRVSIVLKNGYQGKAATRHICRVPAPEQLTVASVTPTSAKLTWSPPHGMDQTPESYQISYHSGGTEPQITLTHSCSAVLTGLKPCTNYEVSVCTKLNDMEMSEAVKNEVCTVVSAPEQLTVTSVTASSIHLTWSPPHGLNQTPHSYQISYNSEGAEPQTIYPDSCSADITNLEPYTHYSVSICTKLKDGGMSEPEETVVRTAVPGPEQVTVVSVTPTSAELTWSPPHGIDQTPESYQISYHKGGPELKTISCCLNITGLKPCTSYTVGVRVKLKDGGMSEAVGTVVHTETPVPQMLKVFSVTPSSAKLTWKPPHGMDHTPFSYQISHSGGSEPKTISEESCKADITGLKPCTDYVVRVFTKPKDWKMSGAVEIKVPTSVPAPEQLMVSVAATSAELTWSPPHGMDQTPESYQISYHRKGTKPLTISSDSCSANITGLQPDTDYEISVCAKPKDKRKSEFVEKKIHTEILTRNYYTIVIGNTQNHHQALKGMLTNKALKEVKHLENCDLILAFCVIVSRVGTDMEAALKEIPDCKPAVLAVMHHTFDPDHVTPDTSRFVRGRNIMVVDILFHEDKGILRCQKNTEAQSKMHEMVWTCSESGGPKKLLPPRQAQPPQATPHNKTDAPKNSASYSVPSQHGHSSEMAQKSHGYNFRRERKESTEKAFVSSASSTEVKYSAIVSGNTLGADKDVKKRLTDKGVLPKEVSLAAQCNFLMVFCPIVSSVGSDIEKALKQIPDGKPYILVVMHHTFNADYLPPDTRRYAKDKDMIIVDCLFYEDTGLLKCQRNDEALNHVSKWLQGKFPNVVEKSQNVSWPSFGGLFSRR